jgi:hypothetical protein
MPELLASENFISIHGTMVTLSCYQDGSDHIVRLELEIGPCPIEARFSSRDKARNHWQSIKETLAALGFKRI